MRYPIDDERKNEVVTRADVSYDEHGGYKAKGDYRESEVLDYVDARKAKKVPYCDMGGRGLVLVTVTRTRYYGKHTFHNPQTGNHNCYRPSSVNDTYLCGRNEVGTFFAHCVPNSCETVEEALDWIWRGQAHLILQRQGDIALIRGNGGPRMPTHLPSGHERLRIKPFGVKTELPWLVHPTHPALPLPRKGQRIIVGRRAAEKGTGGTRD